MSSFLLLKLKNWAVKKRVIFFKFGVFTKKNYIYRNKKFLQSLYLFVVAGSIADPN